MSESLKLGIILALAGGFMDAYSYVCRGQVFANAQTGNILLFGVELSKGSWKMALSYLCPVLAFTLGISMAVLARHFFKNKAGLHWRQLTILLEAIILIFVGFLPLDINLLANSLTSFACGLQVESFQKINGYGAATTMCIGNLRTATQSFCEYFYVNEPSSIKKSALYLLVICIFVIGAVFGNAMVGIMKQSAIIVCGLILFIGFLMMFSGHKKNDQSVI